MQHTRTPVFLDFLRSSIITTRRGVHALRITRVHKSASVHRQPTCNFDLKQDSPRSTVRVIMVNPASGYFSYRSTNLPRGTIKFVRGAVFNLRRFS